MKIITQPKNKYAFKYTDTKKDFVCENVLLTNGGLLLAESGGKSIKLKNVGSKGEVGGGGIYFFITANKRVNSIHWDNSEYPDWWIRSSSSTEKGKMPGEAAFRLMGGVGKAIIIGVNFKCGTWVNKEGKKDWWKQVVQIRDIEEAEFYNSKFVGPVELGRQKDPGGAAQRVGIATFTNCGFTQLPRFSIRSSVKKVVFRGCYEIDNNGKPTGKLFPDQVW